MSRRTCQAFLLLMIYLNVLSFCGFVFVFKLIFWCAPSCHWFKCGFRSWIVGFRVFFAFILLSADASGKVLPWIRWSDVLVLFLKFVSISIAIIMFQSHFHLATSRVCMVCIYQCLTILSFPKRYGFPIDSINSKIVRLMSPCSLRSCLLARSRNQRQSFNRTFSTTHNVQ